MVQPVWIDYGPEAAAIAWVGDEHGLDNFMKILARRRPIPVTLHFLPVLTEAETASHRSGLNGVPTFIINGQPAFSGAQRAELILQHLMKAVSVS